MTRGQKILDKIMSASAVIIDDITVTFPSSQVRSGTGSWEDDAQNEVLIFDWTDEDFNLVSITFDEKALSEARIKDDGSLILFIGGTPYNIKLLSMLPVNKSEIEGI